MTAELNISPAAAKIIVADVRAFKADGKRYAQYVTEAQVTLDTVAAHVAVFREAFKSANPKADGDAVKAYATKVRNGLNRQLGKATERSVREHWLLTTDGLAALSDMDADDMLKAITAEMENRAALNAA